MSTEAMRQQKPSVQLCDTKHATQQKPEGSVEPFYGSCYLFSAPTASLLVPGAVTYFPCRVSPNQLANGRA